MKHNQLQSILYHIKQTDLEINVILKEENIWATQKAMAKLFGVNVSAINKHLNSIYNEGELKKDPTISKMEIVQIKRSKEGNTKGARIQTPTILMPLSQSAIAIPNKPQTLKSTQKEIK